jgi:hypothetical protein
MDMITAKIPNSITKKEIKDKMNMYINQLLLIFFFIISKFRIRIIKNMFQNNTYAVRWCHSIKSKLKLCIIEPKENTQAEKYCIPSKLKKINIKLSKVSSKSKWAIFQYM